MLRAMPVEVLSSVAGTSFPADWYDAASADHFWMAWRFAAFLRFLGDLRLPLEAPLRGLDIGCGGGVTGAQLEAATAWTVDGADINEAALAQARGGRGRVLLYDIGDRRPELRERYDFLILFDVIEHIEDPAPFLDAALAHLKPRGWLFVDVPAMPSLFSAYDEAVGHFRRYDRKSLARALDCGGMELAEIRAWGASLVPLLAIRSLLLALKKQKDVVGFGFTPPARWINAALKGVMRTEICALSRPAIGSSLLAAARKP